jgi:hypothetical protein
LTLADWRRFWAEAASSMLHWSSHRGLAELSRLGLKPINSEAWHTACFGGLIA